jgi:hypothetical protein
LIRLTPKSGLGDKNGIVIITAWLFAGVLVAAQTFNLPLPSIWSAFLNPYNWTLLLVLIFSVMTGCPVADSTEVKS